MCPYSVNLPLIKSFIKKCKEDSYRPKYTTRFLICLKRSDWQIFKNSSCKKPFLQSVCYWFNLLWWLFFILCDNWNTLFFIKISPFSEGFLTATFLLSLNKCFKRKPYSIHYLHNNRTMLIPKFYNKAVAYYTS